MGLFDQIAGGIKNAMSEAIGQGNLLEGIQHLLTSADTGGLEGLVQKFKDKGLGDTIASWIGTGANLPITQDKIQQVLGNSTIQQLAQKAGLSTDEISQKLAVILPQVIDKLTPNGKLPDGATIAGGLNMLKEQFFKKG